MTGGSPSSRVTLSILLCIFDHAASLRYAIKPHVSGVLHRDDRYLPTGPSLGRLAGVHFDHGNCSVLHGCIGLSQSSQNIPDSQGESFQRIKKILPANYLQKPELSPCLQDRLYVFGDLQSLLRHCDINNTILF